MLFPARHEEGERPANRGVQFRGPRFRLGNEEADQRLQESVRRH